MWNFLAVLKSRGHQEWHLLLKHWMLNHLQSLCGGEGKEQNFCLWDNPQGEEDWHSTEVSQAISAGECNQKKREHFSNWLENPKMHPNPSRFPSWCGKRAKTKDTLLWRPVMTRAPVWDSSLDTQRFLLCWLNPELYPMLLLEEADLIIFKVCILADALCFFSPGWNLKWASLFPKWNPLCSISHFSMSRKKGAQFPNQQWMQSYFMLT